MYLIDTNVVSEVRKGQRCDPHVATWWATVRDDDLFLSVLVLGEIRKGAELLHRRDPQRARALEKWLDGVRSAFAGRILDVDQEVADVWGQIAAERPTPVIDGLLAATAIVHDLTLASRNVAHLKHCGAKLIDPFTAKHT